MTRMLENPVGPLSPTQDGSGPDRAASLDRRASVFGRSRLVSDRPHEQVVFCEDEPTGLRAIVAIHNTNLGPALGGTRFYPYIDDQAALDDVLRLSHGMTYKAAAAGVSLGGGKAVVVGDPTTLKTADLLGAYGRFVETLGGRYVTAGDVGTTTDDLDVIGRHTRWVMGRSVRAGGSGDSAYLTALGVFHAMRAGAESVWGEATLAGRTVGIEGVGKVGRHLAGLLSADGASVVVTDVNRAALDAVRAVLPSVEVRESVLDARVDVYAPCALGARLTVDTVPTVSAALVCGAANNQFSTPDVEDLLRSRGTLWIPDYVANAGGLIQVAGELYGHARVEVEADVARIYDRAREIVTAAVAGGTGTGAAADAIADRRIDAAAAVR